MTVEKCTLPNGLEIEFYPETHQYFVQGKEVPSITNLLKLVYGDTYGAVNPAVLKASADYGTAVHNELDQLITARREYPENPIDLSSVHQEVRNYFNFVEDIYKIKPIMNEKMVALYDNLGNVVACGRFDMICEVNGKLTLTDFKTTSTIHKKLVAAQLNLYMKAAHQSGYLTDDQDVDLGVIHLSGETARYIPMPKFGATFYLQFMI